MGPHGGPIIPHPGVQTLEKRYTKRTSLGPIAVKTIFFKLYASMSDNSGHNIKALPSAANPQLLLLYLLLFSCTQTRLLHTYRLLTGKITKASLLNDYKFMWQIFVQII